MVVQKSGRVQAKIRSKITDRSGTEGKQAACTSKLEHTDSQDNLARNGDQDRLEYLGTGHR